MSATRRWFIVVALGGLGFGLTAERRLFGEGFFAHPVVAFFILVGIGLIVLRTALARPVPEIIRQRIAAMGSVREIVLATARAATAPSLDALEIV